MPSPFGLFPDVDWAEVAANLQQGAVQGVSDALSGLGLPPPAAGATRLFLSGPQTVHVSGWAEERRHRLLAPLSSATSTSRLAAGNNSPWLRQVHPLARRHQPRDVVRVTSGHRE